MEEKMSDKENNQPKDERSALEIINDPKYRVDAATQQAEAAEKGGISRRDMLKYGGAVTAALSIAGSAATGFATGRSADAATGLGRTYMGKDQFFNREPFRAEKAAMMNPVAEVTRADWYDYYLRRWKESVKLIFRKQWNPSEGVETMPGYLGEYYKTHPKELKQILENFDLLKKRSVWLNEGAYDRYALLSAYKAAHDLGGSQNMHGFPIPEDPEDFLRITGKVQPPEEWDFRHVKNNRKKMEFKSPKHASELIKTFAHRFGASMVAITDLDPAFVFKNVMRGYPNLGVDWGDSIPEHWKNVIVFAIPSEWDGLQSASYSTSDDRYLRLRITGGLLERFIQELGYPARAQTPVATYEIMITPYVLKSGLGEYARAGYAMIPEIGSNFSAAAVVTNIDFELDKPINIGMAKFCMKCKICADTCPSGAIETTDEPTQTLRGFKRWVLDSDTCFKGWMMSPNGGCAMCQAVCPFTRKNTWIHAISRELDARDATGLIGDGLLAMQQNFFRYPTGEEFRNEFHGGKSEVYHNPPDWYRTENWFSNIDQYWAYKGMH